MTRQVSTNLTVEDLCAEDDGFESQAEDAAPLSTTILCVCVLEGAGFERR